VTLPAAGPFDGTAEGPNTRNGTNATVYRNLRAFTADLDRPWAPAFAVHDGRFLVAGCDEEVVAAAERAASSNGGMVEQRDLEGRLVLPGIVDGHFHLMGTGESLQRVDLVRAKSLEEIQRLVRAHADAHPDAAWLLGKSWLFDAIPGGEPSARLIDQVVPDRPVMLDANDYHSTWVNTVGLRELGITDTTLDPAGGRIARDSDGKATGFLEETAADRLAWSHLENITTNQQRREHLRAAVSALNAAGLTTVIDMGMNQAGLDAIFAAEQEGWLDVRVVAHWFMNREGSVRDHLAQVEYAAELAQRHQSDRFRIAGIKFIVDGVIDGCTAHVSEPYTTGALPEPIWDLDALAPVVAAADKAGLQVAMHAIGDAAVKNALEAVRQAVDNNGGDAAARRHRIEHIEYCDPNDIAKFTELGITASMQPVHADPAIQDNWRAMLGPERTANGFPAATLVAAGARLVLGTDAPTAPFAPLPNLFIATTRRSALDRTLPANEPKNALPLEDAVRYATANAAWSCFAEDRLGSIAPGRRADFILVEPDVTESDADSLLDATVLETVVSGTTVRGEG
jgi:predicted amidohydrolase YtcJ